MLEFLSSVDMPTPDPLAIEGLVDGLGEGRRYMPLPPEEMAASEVLVWATNLRQLVGLAGVRVRHRVPLLHLAVLPEWQGQGLGRALTDRLLRSAESRFAWVALSVHRDNPAAVHLYRTLGFRAVARTPRSHWMVRPLTSVGQLLCAALVPAGPLLSIVLSRRERSRD